MQNDLKAFFISAMGQGIYIPAIKIIFFFLLHWLVSHNQSKGCQQSCMLGYVRKINPFSTEDKEIIYM